MKIGYLHIGPAQHGIRRYSELIAAQARQCGFTVVEASVALTENQYSNREILTNAAKQLASADVIHLQHNPLLWGERSQFANFRAFVNSCSCPLIVTLHDIYVPQKSLSWKNIFVYAKAYVKTKYSLNSLFLRWMFTQVQRVLVCTEQEVQRLYAIVGTNTEHAQKIKHIPHFVEERQITANSAIAREKLNLQEFKTVTLLGWIFPRKGHRLVVQALPYLPSDVKVIFAGRPSIGCEWFLEETLNLAKTLGVEERLRVTGYLSEEELEQYLVATDLAICPFRTSSASGSLSTWLSIAHPTILAFDLPLIKEYNKLESGAIKTFQPYTPNALAQEINQLLTTCNHTINIPVKQLQQRLSMSVTFDEHLKQYTQICAVSMSASNNKYLQISSHK